MRRRSTALLAALTTVLWAAGPVLAQPDPNLKPTFGTVTLQAGFLPDPHTKALQAGGNLRTNLGGVNAYVARAPDYRLHYTKGKFPLVFSVQSDGDTTLLINLPDGTWIADDDSGGGVDPLIRLLNPQSGRYDIYVGTFKKDLLAATLTITERDATREPPPTPIVSGKLPDCYIVSAGVDSYRNAKRLNGCLNDARNTAAAFKAQTGRLFGKVEAQILLDAAATRVGIMEGLSSFTRQGAPHDFMVLFLSGHGGRVNGERTWFYYPFDFSPNDLQNTMLTDRAILDVGEALVKQKKNFVIIVDACFSGQLAITAHPYLNRYRTANEGGMILMLSSSPYQTSAALGNFSAFAKAFTDAMAGAGDLNRDSKVTLGEIQLYTQQRTSQLLAEARITDKQDSVVSWSPSISKDTPFAYAGKGAAPEIKLAATGTPTRWTGRETLAGYGNLSFALYPGGRAVMTDARATAEGLWRNDDNHFTLSFSHGSVVYTGTRAGTTLSGTATSPSPRQQAPRTWNWTVNQQPGG